MSIRESLEAEHISNELVEGITDVCSSLVIIKIVLLLSEAQSVLIDKEDIHLRILLVSLKGLAHWHTIAEACILQLKGTKVRQTLCILHLAEQRLNRTYAFLVTAH